MLAFQPFDTQGLPPPETTRIIVAELDGPGTPIIAYWCVFTAIHVEPVWIHPDHRGRAGLVRALWRTIRGVLNGQSAFACIFDADAPRSAPLARKLGMEKLPGDLYFLSRPAPLPEDD